MNQLQGIQWQVIADKGPGVPGLLLYLIPKIIAVRKNLFLVLVVSLLSISLFSCKDKPKGPDYTIRMRLAPGDSFHHRIDVTMNSGFSTGGQKMGMNMGMNTDISFYVMGDSANLTPIRMTYNKSKFSMEVSGLPGGQSQQPYLDKVGNRMEGKSVTMLLNKKYEIVDVVGFADLLPADSADSPTSNAEYKQMFSKEQVNNMMGMMFQAYPDKPVKVGESWEKEIETGIAGLGMKMKSRFKLMDVKDGIAIIDIKSSYKGKGNVQKGTVPLDMDMEGEQNGSMRINLSTGYLVDADYKIAIDAEASLMGQKVPYSISGRTVMKGE